MGEHLPFDKRAAIAKCVAGKSFIDIGGLWGIHNELVSVAVKAGARRAALLDIQVEGHAMWADMKERLDGLGVADAEFIVDDASKPGLASRIGQFDLVHSSGVIYHIASPLDYLINLRQVAREWVFVTSMTIPELVRSGDEVLDLRGGKILPAFGLDPSQKRILDAHFESLGLGESKITDAAQTPLTPEGQPNFGPWWFFFTVESLSRLIGAAGLTIETVGQTWQGRSHTFQCRPARTGIRPAPPKPAEAAAVAPSRKQDAQGDPKRAAAEIVEIARANASLNVASWSKGIDYEIDFWENWVKEKGERWKNNFAARIAHGTPIDARMGSLIAALKMPSVSVLDVGAGPLTSLGTVSANALLDIRAVDPLGPLYGRILRTAGIAPPVETEFAPAEALIRYAPPRSFDIVHCCNALDHSINPFLGILNMLTLLKPGGSLYLRHHANEAESENYAGFHQFNFEVRDRRFVIWNRERAIDVGEWLAGFAELDILSGGFGTEIVIRATPGCSGMFDLSNTGADEVWDGVQEKIAASLARLSARADASGAQR